MPTLFSRLRSILGLTKKECTVVIFLAISLLLGNSILYFKRERKGIELDIESSGRLSSEHLAWEYDSLSPGEEEWFKVDINGATVEELVFLPGVGFTTAKRIVEYRESVGPFAKPEDLMNVKGIGEAKYAAMKEYIMVGSQDE